jgi:hypothetical protein
VFKVEGVTGRAEWKFDGTVVLNNEPIKVVVTNGGKDRSGSFIVTCK